MYSFLAEHFPIMSPAAILATLCSVCAFFFWLEKATGWRFFQFVPTLLFIYCVPVLLTNFGVLPAKSPVYDGIQNLLLPMLLTLLLSFLAPSTRHLTPIRISALPSDQRLPRDVPAASTQGGRRRQGAGEQQRK